MKRFIIFTAMVLLTAAVQRSAEAYHDAVPDRGDMNRIRALADDLEEEAEDFLRDVERYRPRDHRGPDHAYDLARQFHLDAAAFHEVVDENSRYPERTLVGYRRMHLTYDRLSRRTDRIELERRAGRHLERIHALVARIDGYYRRPEPARPDWGRVTYLAHQMEELAARVYNQAYVELVRRAHPDHDWRSRDILRRLGEVRTAAARFHDAVEHGRPEPWRVRADFDRLYAAQQAASSHIWSLEYRTRNDFYRLTDHLRELRRLGFDSDRDGRYASDAHSGVPARPAVRSVTGPGASASGTPVRVPGGMPGLLLTVLGAEIR